MTKTATLYRMASKSHLCPYGLKSKDLLKREGYEVDDHLLSSREETDSFKEKHGVKTTPQTFISGERIGGHDDLLKHFGKVSLKQQGTTYQPIIATFGTALLMAIAVAFQSAEGIGLLKVVELFIALSMSILGIMKLRDLHSFTNQFLGYDLLAQRWVPYSYLYPFIETAAGLLMVAGVLTMLAAPSALFIGTIGAVSVFKAVYLDKRDLKCACVGGESNVPLGFISLTENVMMVAMALWMLL